MTKQHFITADSETGELTCHGEWNISNLDEIKKVFEKIVWPRMKKITIDGKAITKMDSAGAFFLNKWITKLHEKNLKVHFENFSEENKKLLSFSEKQTSHEDAPKIKELIWLQKLGKYFLEQIYELYEFINFLGKLFFESCRVLKHPALWRWNTVASVINKAGTSALPIITLLSFMIGVVITYQMGNELRKYGANVFIVNLIDFPFLIWAIAYCDYGRRKNGLCNYRTTWFDEN